LRGGELDAGFRWIRLTLARRAAAEGLASGRGATGRHRRSESRVAQLLLAEDTYILTGEDLPGVTFLRRRPH